MNMRHARALQRIVATAVLTVLVTVLGAWVVAGPAAAHHGRCGYHNEDQYRLGTDPRCRGTDTIAPPIGTLLTRSQLLHNAGWLATQGFEKSFLWFAPQQTVSTKGLAWSYCTGNNPADYNGGDEVCDDVGESVGFEAASLAFGADVPITILGDTNSFIALVCGNFSEESVPQTYHPHLTGVKFHDLDRDGTRDGDEPALAGWQFRVTLAAAALPGQPVGASTVVTTGGDGRWALDLTNLGPGTYQVEELARDGWRVTDGPAARTVSVAEGIGNGWVEAGDWGNAQETDTAKAEFRLVDAPSRIDADTPTELTVEAVLTNHGPTDVVEVVDRVTVTGLWDCTITPADQTVRRTLREGEPVTVRLTVEVMCTEPSDHPFTFADTLTVVGAVGEMAPENNHRSFTHVIEVYDDSDLELSATALSCPADTMIGSRFTCTGTTTVTNQGPYGPTDTDVELALTGPDDCALTAEGPTALDREPVAAGTSATLTAEWTVECSQRSFHEFALAASTAVDHLHVEDHQTDGNRATVRETVEVFETVDLETSVTDLVCTEREASRGASLCTVTVDLTNHGPATDVHTLARIGLDPGEGCTTTVPVWSARTLSAGQTTTVTETFARECATAVRHEAEALVELRNAVSDPHAMDSDSDRLVWLPSDAKPRSLPSSVNVGKAGALPFALLSTAAVDTLDDVDVTSLRYGVMGDEESVTGCKTQGEDVDDDGRLDRVCHADTQATGVACGTTVLVATGRLTDGTRFVSQDDVHVTGCRRTGLTP
jgi:hypothetical protein